MCTTKASLKECRVPAGPEQSGATVAVAHRRQFMTDQDPEQRIFVSGERVQPGAYLDMETGALVHVLEPDELPARVQLVHAPRLFLRVDEAEEARTAADFAMRS